MKKRNLLVSLMTLLLCVSLISGATLALFTSESKVNIAVTSGKVELVAGIEDLETWSLEDDYTLAGRTDGSFTMGGKAEVVAGDVTLDKIVPGDKVKFNVVGTNNSNVNIQYRVSVQAKEACKLLEGLKISIDGVEYSSLYSYKTAWTTLKAGETFEDIEISMELPKEAGNEYQGLTANLVVLVEAIQSNAEVTGVAEVVSFVIVDDATEFRNVFASSSKAIEPTKKYVALANNIELDADDTITVVAGKAYDLDLNGYEISGESDGSGNRILFDVRGELNVSNGSMSYEHVGANMGWSSMSTIFNVTAGGKLSLNKVEANNLGGTDMAFIAHLNNWGEVTLDIQDSKLFSTYCAVRVFNSGPNMNNLTIENSTIGASNMALWVHNYKPVDFGDKLYSGSKEAYDKVKVDERLNFNFLIENPQNTVVADDASNLNAEAKNTFVGKIRFGFTNGDIYYFTANSVVANSNASLDSAITSGAETIYLGEGNFVIPDSAQGKTLTIKGNGNTVIANQNDGSYEGCDYSLDGATVTFEGVVINTDGHTYAGYARLNATYNNCTFNGTYTLYGNSVFNNCTFNISGDLYNIWTWGAPTATFNNCTFNSDGKALLLYGQANTILTLNDCTFNDNGGLSDLKAAIEIGNDYNKSYQLIVNNTVVNGYEINDKGINTGTTLWANKNSMGKDKLNVVVDGVDVY